MPSPRIGHSGTNVVETRKILAQAISCVCVMCQWTHSSLLMKLHWASQHGPITETHPNGCCQQRVYFGGILSYYGIFAEEAPLSHVATKLIMARCHRVRIMMDAWSLKDCTWWRNNVKYLSILPTLCVEDPLVDAPLRGGMWGSWYSLQWCHNEPSDVSNHQPHDCLLNCLFRRRSKKTSKLRTTGLCEGNSPVTGKFPAHKGPATRKMFPFDDVIMFRTTKAWTCFLHRWPFVRRIHRPSVDSPHKGPVTRIQFVENRR